MKWGSVRHGPHKEEGLPDPPPMAGARESGSHPGFEEYVISKFRDRLGRAVLSLGILGAW